MTASARLAASPTRSWCVKVEGFKLLKAGMSVLQALTQPREHLFPYPGVSKESGRSWLHIFLRARLASG